MDLGQPARSSSACSSDHDDSSGGSPIAQCRRCARRPFFISQCSTPAVLPLHADIFAVSIMRVLLGVSTFTPDESGILQLRRDDPIALHTESTRLKNARCGIYNYIMLIATPLRASIQPILAFCIAALKKRETSPSSCVSKRCPHSAREPCIIPFSSDCAWVVVRCLPARCLLSP